MSLRDYIAAKAVPLCIAAMAGLYLALVGWFCAIPCSLLLILLFLLYEEKADEEVLFALGLLLIL